MRRRVPATAFPARAGREGQPATAPAPRASLCAFVVQVQRLNVVSLALGRPAARAVSRAFGRRIRVWAPGAREVRDLGAGRYLAVVTGLDTTQARIRGERLAELLAAPVHTDAGEVARTVSVGIACAGGESADLEEMIRRAAAAAGWAGSDAVRVWDSRSAAREFRAAQLELRLQSALRSGTELLLYFQPEVELHDGRLVAVEALARWRHPTLGLIGADEIIPVAEASGTIVEFGRWALGFAFDQRARWAAAYPGVDFAMFVNVSPTQLQRDDDLPGFVGHLLAHHRLRGNQVGVELTEEVRTLDSPRAIAALASLRGLGVQIAIDDFGVAHSSPARLEDFPFDTVKIDGRFIHGSGGGARSTETTRYVVSSVVHLAERLGMAVVAEGIETSGEVAEMINLGCFRGQGNGLMPAVDARRLASVIAAGGIDLP